MTKSSVLPRPPPPRDYENSHLGDAAVLSAAHPTGHAHAPQQTPPTSCPNLFGKLMYGALIVSSAH